MKLAIDITYTPSGGSLTQILNMIKYFNLDENINIVIYSKKKNEEKLKDVIKNENRIMLSWFANIATPTRVVWEQLFLPFYLKRDKIDVLFCPGNIAPFFSTVKTLQWIGTIGPFWDEIYANDIGLKKRLKYPVNKFLMYKTAQKSEIVIFESCYTKNLFIANYGIDINKARVIHIGKDEFFTKPIDKNNLTLNISMPFILCVSHLYPYKNIIRMIEAFANANKKNAGNIKLYIAGSIISKQYYASILEVIKARKLNDKVVFLGSVSKENLHYLYSNCEFMIFPSPCENFAYTLVEAMSCGTPIICSNTTAMPETCGDAALYFDPYNTDELSEQISSLLLDKKLCKSFRGKSIVRANELPDYAEVTLQTLDIMRSLVNENY